MKHIIGKYLICSLSIVVWFVGIGKASAETVEFRSLTRTYTVSASFGADTLLLGDAQGRIWLSTDQGTTLRLVYQVHGAGFRNCQYDGEGRVVVLTSGGELHLSRNHGYSWTKLVTPLPVGGFALSQDGRATILVMSGERGLYLTDDLGQSWRALDVPVGKRIQAIGFADSSAPIVQHSDGSFLHFGGRTGISTLNTALEIDRFNTQFAVMPTGEILGFSPYGVSQLDSLNAPFWRRLHALELDRWILIAAKGRVFGVNAMQQVICLDLQSGELRILPDLGSKTDNMPSIPYTLAKAGASYVVGSALSRRFRIDSKNWRTDTLAGLPIQPDGFGITEPILCNGTLRVIRMGRFYTYLGEGEWTVEPSNLSPRSVRGNVFNALRDGNPCSIIVTGTWLRGITSDGGRTFRQLNMPNARLPENLWIGDSVFQFLSAIDSNQLPVYIISVSDSNFSSTRFLKRFESNRYLSMSPYVHTLSKTMLLFYYLQPRDRDRSDTNTSVGFGVLSSKDLGKTWNRKIELRGWTVYALPTIDSSNFVHFSVIQSLSSGTVEHHLTYNVLLDSISYSEPPKAGEGRRRIFFANKRRFGIRDYFDGNYSESFDGGVTWSQPKEWGLVGTRWFPRTDSSLVGHSELDVSEAYIRPRVSAIEIDSTKLDRIAPVWVWSIAPNPVNGLLRIDLSLHGSSSRSAMRMAIVDMLGNVVGDLKPLLDSLAINQRSVLEWEVPPELPAGAYVLVFGDDTWRKSMMIAVTR